MAYDLDAAISKLKEILEQDPLLEGWVISRSEPIPEIPQRVPWLGIYKRSEEYSPNTIAAGNRPWRVPFSIDLVLLECSIRGGEEADQRLEAAKKALFTVLEKRENLNLQGVALLPLGWSVEYSYGSSDEGAERFYSVEAAITMNLEARA